MQKKIKVTKIFKFSAAHQLCNSKLDKGTNERLFGECSKMHGHNYTLEVTVSGTISKKTGMVINFNTIKEVVKRVVISKLDHRNLSALPEFKKIIPTAENIAEFIVKELKQEKLPIKNIKLWETDTSFVEISL